MQPDECKQAIEFAIANYTEACKCVGEASNALQCVISESPDALLTIAKAGDFYLTTLATKSSAKRSLDEAIAEYGRAMSTHGYNVAVDTYCN